MSSIFASMDISTSALKAQKMRMEVIANNIANINTTHDEYGKNNPYRRKTITFSEILGKSGGINSPGGVSVLEIADDMSAFNTKYEPGHPDADDNGYIKIPNVDAPTEMVDMITASRNYEANIAAIEIAKNMINNSFEILA
ncbi:MAG: flagellar basal body rod protein FlgC [Planctomycetota bacterium]|nr:MAG: flagellar basal body rod protein FlgC [Planctomycetota bacterium]